MRRRRKKKNEQKQWRKYPKNTNKNPKTKVFFARSTSCTVIVDCELQTDSHVEHDQHVDRHRSPIYLCYTTRTIANRLDIVGATANCLYSIPPSVVSVALRHEYVEIVLNNRSNIKLTNLYYQFCLAWFFRVQLLFLT